MKAASFDYLRAASIEEAATRLREHGDGAKLLAGGQSLVPMMAMRLARPALLVDIGEIAALRYVSIEGDQARIGAGTRQGALERDAALLERVPLLGQALAWVAHAQIRDRGTIGGSLAHADPAAELPLVAQTLGATMLLRSTRGSRQVAAAEFFTGPLTTALAADECLEEIRLPLLNEAGAGSSFTELCIRHGDYALVAAAAHVVLAADGCCQRARFGIGGAGPAPLAFPALATSLVGQRLEDRLIETVAAEAARATDPWSDLHASAQYRRHLAGVLTARALREARDRAAASA